MLMLFSLMFIGNLVHRIQSAFAALIIVPMVMSGVVGVMHAWCMYAGRLYTVPQRRAVRCSMDKLPIRSFDAILLNDF